jgi:hypothetical protein
MLWINFLGLKTNYQLLTSLIIDLGADTGTAIVAHFCPPSRNRFKMAWLRNTGFTPDF